MKNQIAALSAKIDRQLLRRFRATAQAKDLTLQQAVADAMEAWIQTNKKALADLVNGR